MEHPESAAGSYAEGLSLSSAGCLPEAITALEAAVGCSPENASYQYQLGLSYHQAERGLEAAVALGKAIALEPKFHQAWTRLTAILVELGDCDAAVRAGQEAVRLEPGEPDGYANLSKAYAAKGDANHARSALHSAIGLHLKLAQALGRKRSYPQAWEHQTAALNLAPQHPHCHFCAGVLCLGENRLDLAAAHLRKAIDLQTDRPEFWVHLAQVHLRRRSLTEAVECLERSLALDPQCSDAHYLLGWIQLSLGNFKEGWSNLEPRWIMTGPRDSGRPIWAGEPLEGRTILLYLHHGFGDTLHFVRYVPWVASRGGKVVLECSPALAPLLSAMSEVDTVVALGQPLPAFDVQSSLLSLPRIFQSTLDRIPRQIPYLRAPATSQVVLPAIPGARLKVGLVWGGSALRIFDQNRSLPFAALAPLLDIDAVGFYSLQVGGPAEQLRRSKWVNQVVDLGPHLTDFAATASAVDQMDLVITVDTSVAHLAGALGKPVWVLLLFFADWRWMHDREDNLWYPTMRLFRQRSFDGGWDEPVGRLAEALKQFVRGPNDG